jgi:predicted phage terminase large subunit-like protein
LSRELQQLVRENKLALAEVLGYDFQIMPHAELFGLYLKYDKDTPLLTLDSVKKRLVLWPRGHYKTSSIVVEIVQLLLNYPNARILLMQSTVKNTKALLKEVKSHFDGTNPRSNLGRLFPDRCAPDLGDANGFQVPGRTRVYKEPSVYCASPKATKAGFHFDVMFADDLVTEVNYKNNDLQKALITDFSHYVPLIDPGGYIFVTGTRYTFGDLYEHIIRGNTTEHDWNISIRAAWEGEGDGRHVIFPRTLLPDGRPVGFTLDLLEQIQRENPLTFAAQYMNQPIMAGLQMFPETLILSHMKAQADLPEMSGVYLAIDDATGQEERADDRVIVAGRTDSQGRIYIVDIRGGQWTPSVFSAHVLDMTIRHRPWRVILQKTSAAVMFEMGLQALARDKQIQIPIEMVKVANTKGAKHLRISQLEGHLKRHRLWFSTGLQNWPKVLEQFSQFPRGRHDDYPDCIGILVEYLSQIVTFRPPRPMTMMHMIRAVEGTMSEEIVKEGGTATGMTCGFGFPE